MLCRRVLTEDDYEKVAATRYAHSTTLNSFFARLGLFKPADHLYAEDFPAEGRVFRTTYNVPLGSNLALVLYECDDGDHRVKAFVNDRPTAIPGCPDGDTCSYQQVLSLWQEWSDTCNLTEICELGDSL